MFDNKLRRAYKRPAEERGESLKGQEFIIIPEAEQIVLVFGAVAEAITNGIKLLRGASECSVGHKHNQVKSV